MSPRSLLSIATGAGLGFFGAVLLQMDPAEQAEARSPAAEPAAVKPSGPAPAKEATRVKAAPPAPAEPAVVPASERSAPAAERKSSAPKTAAEVTRAEMACDARDKTGCLLAAEAYEAGVVVTQNLALARNYRKRELTLVVRSCDARSPAGCLELSERYARGDGVEQSEKKAEALVAHARELCTLKQSPECEPLLAAR